MHLVTDLAAMLSRDIDDDVTPTRVRNALHRLNIKPKRGEIEGWEYRWLYKFFDERRVIETKDACKIFAVVGQMTAEQLLDKDFWWRRAVRCGRIHMNMKQYRVLEEHVRERSSLAR